MSLLFFSEIRFADPITAISSTKNFVVHGSAMGRVVFYCHDDGKEYILTENNSELIRGIDITQDGDRIFVCVGDVEAIPVRTSDLEIEDGIQLYENPTGNISSAQHNEICERTYVFLHENISCVFSLNPAEKYKDDVENNNKKYEHFLLRKNLKEPLSNVTKCPNYKGMESTSVPFDFDGRRLLYIDFEKGFKRYVRFYDCDEDKVYDIFRFEKRDGILSHLKLKDNFIYFVKNDKQLMRHNITTHTSENIGSFKYQIVAINFIKEGPMALSVGGVGLEKNEEIKDDKKDKKNNEFSIEMEERKRDTSVSKEYKVIALDERGNIKIFHDFIQSQKFQIKNIMKYPKEYVKKDLFEMGYPYFVDMYNNILSVSSDYGVFIIKTH